LSRRTDLLVAHFGLDSLEVRLLAATSDEGERQRLRDNLARIVEAAGGDSQVIQDIAMQAERRQRNVNQMRKLGLAVQECVKVAMERHGLVVRDVDHGYDFWVTPVEVRDDDPEELSSYFEVAGYKVEVKTTKTGEARLTPLQAATSAGEPDVFVLCVVDLRCVTDDVHEVDWNSQEVSPLCTLVSGRDLPIKDTVRLVERAEGSDVPIRNATGLRYAVRPQLWESGLALDAWVEAAFEIRQPGGSEPRL
jgi:hypothetical protein